MNNSERESLIEKYADGFAEVQRSLEGFPADKLREKPFTGKWSATEIIHHLADSEMNSAIRLRKLLAEEKPLIYGYDQDYFAEVLRYNERPFAPSLAAFRFARETCMQIIPFIKDEDWKREGWHTEGGLYTTETWLEIYAAHAHGHAEQIVRLRDFFMK